MVRLQLYCVGIWQPGKGQNIVMTTGISQMEGTKNIRLGNKKHPGLSVKLQMEQSISSEK
jgi:hypothetical protein